MRLIWYYLLFALRIVAETYQQCASGPDNPEPIKYTRPPIEIRAILVRCLVRKNVYKNVGSEKDHIPNTRNREVLQFYGFDEDEPMLHSEVTNCNKKLQISVLFNHDAAVIMNFLFSSFKFLATRIVI